MLSRQPSLNPVATIVRARPTRATNMPRRMQRGKLTKPIEDIQVGDQVWAWDEQTGESVRRPVVRLFRHQGKPTTAVTVVGDDGVVQRIECTTEHPFWVEGKGWVAACELQARDLLKRIDTGTCLRVASSELTGVEADVFNFEVEGAHNYFVSPRGVLVHNTSKYELGVQQALKELPTFGGSARALNDKIAGMSVVQLANRSFVGPIMRSLRDAAPQELTGTADGSSGFILSLDGNTPRRGNVSRKTDTILTYSVELERDSTSGRRLIRGVRTHSDFSELGARGVVDAFAWQATHTELPSGTHEVVNIGGGVVPLSDRRIPGILHVDQQGLGRAIAAVDGRPIFTSSGTSQMRGNKLKNRFDAYSFGGIMEGPTYFSEKGWFIKGAEFGHPIVPIDSLRGVGIEIVGVTTEGAVVNGWLASVGAHLDPDLVNGDLLLRGAGDFNRAE